MIAVHAEFLETKGIRFVDCGVSGGVWGLENGYGLMAGGDAAGCRRGHAGLRSRLAGGSARRGAIVHAGPVPGRGTTRRWSTTASSTRSCRPGPRLRASWTAARTSCHDVTAAPSRRGSAEPVVRSWLLELLGEGARGGPGVRQNIEGYVEDSGEGRWTVHEALDQRGARADDQRLDLRAVRLAPAGLPGDEGGRGPPQPVRRARRPQGLSGVRRACRADGLPQLRDARGVELHAGAEPRGRQQRAGQRPTWSKRSAICRRSGSHRVSTGCRRSSARARDAAIVASAARAHGERQVLVELQLNRAAREPRTGQSIGREAAASCRARARACCSPRRTSHLVRGEPSVRRRYLDQLLTLRTPRFAGVLADYDRVLQQRNTLLKSARALVRDREGPSAPSRSGTSGWSRSAPRSSSRGRGSITDLGRRSLAPTRRWPGPTTRPAWRVGSASTRHAG